MTTAGPALALAAALAVAAAEGAHALGERCPSTRGKEEALERGEILIELTEHAGSEAKEGCVVGYIAAPPEAVFRVLQDAGSYDEYMPRVRSSEVSTGGGDVVLNRQVLELPFPIGDRRFTIRLRSESLDGGTLRLSWTYVPGSGNVEDTRGYWLVEPWHGGSRVTYVLWSDPGGVIPKWAVNRASRRTLPRVVEALRERVLERNDS
jgi:hypothetical protein